MFEALERSGLLLESDPLLPSVVSLMVGSPVHGSWWGHPRGHAIYHVSGELAHHPDVVVARLVSGKVTYVHRRLWPALLSVATAREPWQMGGLSSAARALLAQFAKQETVRLDHLAQLGRIGIKGLRQAAQQLETRLLVRGGSVHTETGAHARYVETWECWAGRARFRRKRPTAEQGKRALEDALQGLSGPSAGRAVRLPWKTTKGKSAKVPRPQASPFAPC